MPCTGATTKIMVSVKFSKCHSTTLTPSLLDIDLTHQADLNDDSSAAPSSSEAPQESSSSGDENSEPVTDGESDTSSSALDDLPPRDSSSHRRSHTPPATTRIIVTSPPPPSTTTATVADVLQPRGPVAIERRRYRVKYQCANTRPSAQCGIEFWLTEKDAIRCRECGSYIVMKVRTNKMCQFEAR